MNENLEKLKWVKTPLLDDGFVTLVDCMGSDKDIVEAARLSYNKDSRDDLGRFKEVFLKLWGKEFDNYAAPEQVEKVKQKLLEDERTLLRYLMRHRHTSPFEQAELKFLIRIPMDAWRQMIRHRTANVNEYSTRYTEAIDSKQTTGPDQWRTQATSNKQGSGGLLDEWPEGWTATPNEVTDPEEAASYKLVYESKDKSLKWTKTHVYGDGTVGDFLTQAEEEYHDQADILYKTRLSLGVAREQARKDLPLSTYTEAYWKCDLHNIMHYLGLRMDSHAQKEIRDYANAIGDIVKQLFPLSWEAFIDYKFEATTLSRLDKLLILSVNRDGVRFNCEQGLIDYCGRNPDIGLKGRELSEAYQKLVNLGLAT